MSDDTKPDGSGKRRQICRRMKGVDFAREEQLGVALKGLDVHLRRLAPDSADLAITQLCRDNTSLPIREPVWRP